MSSVEALEKSLEQTVQLNCHEIPKFSSFEKTLLQFLFLLNLLVMYHYIIHFL